MKKALITYDYGEERMAELAKVFDLTYHYEGDIESFKDSEDIEVLICYSPFKNLNIDDYPNLKWIQLSSIGFDQIPRDKMVGRDIIVTNNQGGYSKPMGEFIVSKMLEVYKHSRNIYDIQKTKKWKMDTGLLELVDKKIVFLGTGTISKEAAMRLVNWEMDIVGVNTKGHQTEYFDRCIAMDHVADEISDADFIVVALPHTKSTEHLVDEKMLSHMKDDAVLINISRGKVVDEMALTEALRRGKFLGVALDVFDKEPLDESSPLWSFDQVLISCHNSWISERRNERRFNMIYANVKRYLNNQPLKNVVDLERGY